jgi:signal transduction histidine kinase
MRQCLLNGADDLLFKPIRRDELLAILESKLERFEKIKKAYSNIYIGENRNLLHEVNTPLTGIIGAVELLRTYGNDITVSEVADFHYDIKLAGERLSRTMKNLFLYQNFINNNLEFSSGSSTAVLESFTRIKKKIYSVHKGCEGRINFDIQESNLRISQTYLDFILYELIDNALKFSGDKPISIWGKVYCATYFYLAIKDRGIGFKQEELERINAGQQFNREKTEQQGLGLGLFLSKKILKKGKGVFTIISKKEKGTEISLFFPLQATEVVNNG